MRLHAENSELRQKPDALDLEKRLRKAWRETSKQRSRAEMWRERAGLAGWTKEMRHGTDHGYSDGACRCESCRHAHTAARRARRNQAKA